MYVPTSYKCCLFSVQKVVRLDGSYFLGFLALFIGLYGLGGQLRDFRAQRTAIFGTKAIKDARLVQVEQRIDN